MLKSIVFSISIYYTELEVYDILYEYIVIIDFNPNYITWAKII